MNKTAFQSKIGSAYQPGKHESQVARASFVRGNAAGVHGPLRYGKADRRRLRKEERTAEAGEGW
jgi:hypothetical protein